MWARRQNCKVDLKEIEQQRQTLQFNGFEAILEQVWPFVTPLQPLLPPSTSRLALIINCIPLFPRIQMGFRILINIGHQAAISQGQSRHASGNLIGNLDI